jgi:signal transduction histidine kinase
MERTQPSEHGETPARDDAAAPPAAAEVASSSAHVGPSPRDLDQRELLVRLAAGLAHEIKNPLSTMAINLALMEEDLGGNRGAERIELSPREKRVEKRVRTLQREVQRLETIVEDFLRYARGGQVNRAPADLVQLVREVLEFVEPEDARQGIRHHVELPMGLPLVMLDPGAFRQALLNLFVNARQAMPSGGELIVRARREGNFVELSVTDTGVGMTPEAVEHCFEVYYSTKKGGTGLGLSTTRRIVEEHSGTIVVVSEVGRGTSFSIVLPLLVEIHSPQAGRDGSEAAPAAERPRAPRESREQPGRRGGSR